MPLRRLPKYSDYSYYFITTTVVGFTRVFSDSVACDILINQLKHYREKYQYEILAYVILPSHFHWLIQIDQLKGIISDIMRDIKKYSAWDNLDMLGRKRSDFHNLFVEAAYGSKKQKCRFWMERFDDEVIRNSQMLWTKINYIHNNPVKAGLTDTIENYRYSSAMNYFFDDQSVIEVNTNLAGMQKL